MTTHELLRSQIALPVRQLPPLSTEVNVILQPGNERTTLTLEERSQVGTGARSCVVWDAPPQGWFVTLHGITSGGLLFASASGLFEFLHAHFDATRRH